MAKGAGGGQEEGMVGDVSWSFVAIGTPVCSMIA